VAVLGRAPPTAQEREKLLEAVGRADRVQHACSGGPAIAF